MNNPKSNTIIYICLGIFIVLFVLGSVFSIRNSYPRLKDALANTSLEEIFKNENDDDIELQEDSRGGVENTNQVNFAKVAQLPIYPGCEELEDSKAELINCLSTHIQQSILAVLDTEFPNVNKDKLEVELEFHINWQGLITDVRVVEGDNEFKAQAVDALRQVSDDLKYSGIRIEPAKDEYGKYVKVLLRNKVVLLNPNK